MLKRYKFPLCRPEDGGDATGGGGGTLDYGNELEDELIKTPVADTAEADEEEILGKKEVEKEGVDDEPARDEKTGKFTKKESGDIPKARFDEAVNKERQARELAERRAAEAEAKIRQVDEGEQFTKAEESIEKLESLRDKALLDGEIEKAAELRKQIRAATRELDDARADVRASRATNHAVEEVRMSLVIEKLESTYEQFNPNHENFNQKLVNFALAEQRRLIAEERMSPSAALDRAAVETMELFSPKVKEEPAKQGLAAASKGEDRKAAQVKKNLDTASKQPPSLKDSGMDSDKAGAKVDGDVSQMTAEEWEALPAATKAKLRGDFA